MAGDTATYGSGQSIPGFSPTELLNVLVKKNDAVKTKMDAMNANADNISIADMFEMQMLMNSFSQMSEMSTSVVSAANSAISSAARNVKG